MVGVIVCLGGCGGHKAPRRPETAADVVQELMSITRGLLADPVAASCHRASAKSVALLRNDAGQRPGTSTALVNIRAR